MQQEKYNQLLCLLKRSFSADRLVSSNIFDLSYCYIKKKQQVNPFLDLIQGRNWIEIDWQLIYKTFNMDNELVIPSCLTIDAYTLLFPSFLLDCLLNVTGERDHNSYLLFIDWHLNLSNLKYNDQYEEKNYFLLGLSNDQKNCVAQILLFLTEFEICSAISKEALDSYWIDFL